MDKFKASFKDPKLVKEYGTGLNTVVFSQWLFDVSTRQRQLPLGVTAVSLVKFYHPATDVIAAPPVAVSHVADPPAAAPAAPALPSNCHRYNLKPNVVGARDESIVGACFLGFLCMRCNVTFIFSRQSTASNTTTTSTSFRKSGKLRTSIADFSSSPK